MEHHLKNHLVAILESNGNLGEAIAKYKKKVTYPTCRQLMVEIVIDELLGLAMSADFSEKPLDISAEYIAVNRALLSFLGEIGAGGVPEGLLGYAEIIKSMPGCGDLFILANQTAGRCQSRAFSANPPY